MLTNSQLHFFKQKINDLETAVFYNQSHSVLKIPNNVISVYKVDEIGQLWFFMNPPVQQISEFEHSFFAKLDFLKKGKDFFMKVEGKAYLVTDPEEINSLSDFPEKLLQKARKEQILVKMKVANIGYYEMQRRKRRNRVQQFSNFLNTLLHTRRPSYRLYTLQPDTGF